MTVHKDITDNICTIYLEGRFDGGSAVKDGNELLAILDMRCESFILDMGELTYLSSAGIRILVAMLKKSHALKKALKLKALQPSVRNVLDMTGLLKIIEIEQG